MRAVEVLRSLYRAETPYRSVPGGKSVRGLAAYLAFTAAALIGFATFGRHPELLTRFPQLATLYGTAFRFFAQAHVIVGASVLFLYLIRRAASNWLPGFVLVYTVSLLSELAGTSTGLPFGSYSYSDMLGWKWFDRVPALIPLSWYLMAVPAYLMAHRRYPDRVPHRILLGAALLAGWDLALDPAMSHATGYWTWGESGPYYGMPLLNLIGWMLTGALLMGILDATTRGSGLGRISGRWMRAYYGITILMPLGMMVFSGMWLGVALGLIVPAAVVGLARIPPSTAGTRPAPTHEMRGLDASEFPTTPDAEQTPAVFVHQRAMLVAEGGTPVDFFSRRSLSFAFAARWFNPDARRLVAGLYAFCRTTDDFADFDHDPTAVVTARLDAWQELVERAYFDGASNVPWLDAVMLESRHRGVPIELARDLIAGVRMDLQSVRIRTWEELDEYMYRVASVVGIWMCHLFGVTDPDSLQRAAALGKAMQLTNILRDVGADLDDDRVYLPAEVCERYGIDEPGLFAIQRQIRAGGIVPAAYRACMYEMIGRADALYEYARSGLSALPREFARAAAIASEVYRGIHGAIRANGFDNFDRRARTSLPLKCLLAARALVRLKSAGVSTGTLVLRRVLLRKVAALAAAVVITLPAGIASAHPQAGAAVAVIGAAWDPCPAIADLRAAYFRSVEDGAHIEDARASIEGCREPLYRAYDGALITLRAKHSIWPPSKLKYLRRGLDTLDQMIEQHPADVEIRFLRLMSCYYLPGILGRNWSVQEDFAALADLLPAARPGFPDALYGEMVRFVLDNGHPTEIQRKALEAALDERAS